jgi:hypothetical protein
MPVVNRVERRMVFSRNSKIERNLKAAFDGES